MRTHRHSAVLLLCGLVLLTGCSSPTAQETSVSPASPDTSKMPPEAAQAAQASQQSADIQTKRMEEMMRARAKAEGKQP